MRVSATWGGVGHAQKRGTHERMHKGPGINNLDPVRKRPGETLASK